MFRNGTPLASRVVHAVTGHCQVVFRTYGFMWKMQLGVRAPSCCDFLRVTFDEVPTHRVLIFSGWGNRCLLECGKTNEASSRISI